MPSAGCILTIFLNLTSGTNHAQVTCTHRFPVFDGFSAPPARENNESQLAVSPDSNIWDCEYFSKNLHKLGKLLLLWWTQILIHRINTNFQIHISREWSVKLLNRNQKNAVLTFDRTQAALSLNVRCFTGTAHPRSYAFWCLHTITLLMYCHLAPTPSCQKVWSVKQKS